MEGDKGRDDIGKEEAYFGMYFVLRFLEMVL